MTNPLQTLTLTVDGPVALLTLARPERLNAMSARMLDELIDAAYALDRDHRVRAVVLRGEGRAFCAGVDLGDLGAAAATRPLRDLADLGRRAIDAVAAMRAPTVAAVRGHCVGGGLVLMLACDLRVAADDAVFSVPEAALGLPLGWGGVPRLVREVGPAVARDLVLTCREFGAAEAARLGVVNRVVPADEVDATARGLAETLAGRAEIVVRTTREQVHAAAEDLASTAGAAADADLLMDALADPEATLLRSTYLADRGVDTGDRSRPQ